MIEPTNRVIENLQACRFLLDGPCGPDVGIEDVRVHWRTGVSASTSAGRALVKKKEPAFRIVGQNKNVSRGTATGGGNEVLPATRGYG